MDQEVAKTLGELELKLQELERELTSIGHRDPQPSKLRVPDKLIDEAVERDDDGRTRADALRTNARGSDDARGKDSADRTEPRDDEDERAVDNAFGGPAVFGGEEVPAQGATIERDSAFPVSETAYGEIATGSPAPGSSFPSTAPSFPPAASSFPPAASSLPPTASSFPSGVFSPATTGTPQSEPPLPPPIVPQPWQHPQQEQPPLTPPGGLSGQTPQPPPSTPPGPPPPTTPPGPPPVPPTPTPQPMPPPQPIDRAELARFKEKMQRTMEDLIDEYGRLLLPKPPA